MPQPQVYALKTSPQKAMLISFRHENNRAWRANTTGGQKNNGK